MYTSSTWHNMLLPLTAGWDRESSQWEVLQLGMIALLTRVGSTQVTKIRLDGLNGLSWSIENSIWGIEDCGLWITSQSHRLLCKVTLSSPSLWASFRPLFPLSKDILFKSQYEMLKLSIQCTRFETNYSSCTVRSNEIIRSSSGGGSGKRKDRMKLSLPPKLMVFSVSSPVELLMYVFAGFFWISPCVLYDQTQGSGSVFFLLYG
jgi:hypothetical protein